MTRLTDLQDPYRQTKDATAVAADIATGKTAYGPDGEIIGTGGIPTNGFNGRLIDVEFRKGLSGVFTASDEDHLVKKAGIAGTNGATSINTDGYVYNNTVGGQNVLSYNTVPVYGAGGRKTEVWGKVTGIPTIQSGLNIHTDYVDSSNKWFMYMLRTTQARYDIYMAELAGGSWIPRGSTGYWIPAAFPAYYYFCCTAQGDRISWAINAIDANGTLFQHDTTYSVGSRPGPLGDKIICSLEGESQSLVHVKGFKVTDL